MLELAGSEAAGGTVQFEGPKEVASLLEIGADGIDLVDQVLYTDYSVLAKVGFDKLVVRQSNTLLVDLAITTLVDQFAHRLDRRIAIGDEGLDDFEHFRGGFGKAHEDAIIDLQQTQKLKDFAWFGRDFVNTVK